SSPNRTRPSPAGTRAPTLAPPNCAEQPPTRRVPLPVFPPRTPPEQGCSGLRRLPDHPRDIARTPARLRRTGRVGRIGPRRPRESRGQVEVASGFLRGFLWLSCLVLARAQSSRARASESGDCLLLSLSACWPEEGLRFKIRLTAAPRQTGWGATKQRQVARPLAKGARGSTRIDWATRQARGLTGRNYATRVTRSESLGPDFTPDRPGCWRVRATCSRIVRRPAPLLKSSGVQRKSGKPASSDRMPSSLNSALAFEISSPTPKRWKR